MENVACMVREDEFVVDIVLSTLQAVFSLSAIANGNNLSNLYCGVEFNLTR